MKNKRVKEKGEAKKQLVKEEVLKAMRELPTPPEGLEMELRLKVMKRSGECKQRRKKKKQDECTPEKSKSRVEHR